MAAFDQLKKELQAKKNAEQRAAREKERSRSIQEQLTSLQRSNNPNDPHQTESARQLEKKLREANAGRQAALEDLAASHQRLDGVWKEILPLTDPRERLAQWSDDYPILMFPIRLETRFKKVIGREGAQHDELWVRIYPDDCLVDTFEEDLTEMERRNARRYWALHWAAAGDEAKERQAWRELAAAHGSGRAGWIREHYQPTNPAEQPSAPSNDFQLVIPAQDTEPLGADADAVADFWKKVFLKTEKAANANDLAKKYPPANLKETAPEGANVKVTFVRFPVFGEEASRPFSWSEAPKVKLLPERFVFLGYGPKPAPSIAWEPVKTAIGGLVKAPLAVGPNPSAAKEDQFQEKDGDLVVPEEMRWMTDFEEALSKGMALRIPLESSLAQTGFTRVLVLGVRLGSDQQEAQQEVEELLRHHQFGRAGFSIVPQGTPTNNTDDGPSGYSRTDDPDESFRIFVKKENLFTPTADPAIKTDGQYLAEGLGLDLSLFQQTPNADQTDEAEAWAMNAALWPATMGYWMQKIMNPVFGHGTVTRTRQFFTQYVSGRGHLPAVRIGRQPYGVLQATAYSRLPRAMPSLLRNPFFLNLYQLLMKLDVFWKNMAKNVPHVGNGSAQPQQQLLDIVGLHPASAEYYSRYGHSALYLYNYFLFAGLPFNFWSKLVEASLLASSKQMLKDFGYTGEEQPKIFEKYYREGQQRLNGPIVDDRPMSETQPVRIYSENGKNYIGWLVEALGDYEGKLLPQRGLSERPSALLYILLRHALLEEYDNAGHKTRFDANLIEAATLQHALGLEPEFVHVQVANKTSESRIAHLLDPVPQVTPQGISLAKHIGLEVKKPVLDLQSARELKEMETALGILEKTPTARLERLLAEHVDCCTYRHDAWVQGLAKMQLETMRAGDEGGKRTGLFVGAYAWLENLKPENKQLSTPQLPQDLAEIFQKPGDVPLTSDSNNQGYIHAPSLNHAVTAAVLRNGYLSNATPTQPDLLAVNLSSERVRKALDTLEGIRNGQSLGALLGYRFERSLHDNDPAMFVFSYQLRKAFPLVANKLDKTKEPDPEAQEAIAARNVVDGYALLKKALGTNNVPDFAFLAPLLTDPSPNASQLNLIRETIKDLLDIHDALSDLGIAESVHQIVQGNYDRAAANLDAYSKATFPQIPDVAITPRSGSTLTHRVAVHLNGLAVPNPAHTLRSQAEPALNEWLTELLPSSGDIAVAVLFTNPGQPTSPPETVTLADLGLQPLDLLYLLHQDAQQALGVLDEHVLRFLFKKPTVHPNAKIEIQYTEAVAGKVNFFELAPLLRSLRGVALASRPLRATDAAPPSEATPATEPALTLDKNRITAVLPNTADLAALLASWAALPSVDQQIGEMADAFTKYAQYGVTEAGFGFTYNWRQTQYEAILAKTQARMKVWSKRLVDFDGLVNVDLPAAVTDEEKIDVLRKAEALVSTAFITPLPATVALYQTDVMQKKQDFNDKKTAIEGILDSLPNQLASFISSLNSQLPLSDFDSEAFDLMTDIGAEVARFQQELVNKTTALQAEMERRLAEANKKLLIHDDPSTEASKKMEALQAAGKALFGEDFLLIPNFKLPDAQGFEWQNSLDAEPDLLAFQKTEKQDDFPVDTWFYGMARVREKLHQLENTWLLAEAFGKAPQNLLPTQFPFRKWKPTPADLERPEPWLALEFPSEFVLQEEKVLYTASYAVPFNRTQPQCGLLLDEWTEVVPAKAETTGLTFHYDRPNTEAPQAWLLVTPASNSGEWQWNDLVDALHETLDLAKQRAVEPAQVENSGLGVFSPATVFPVSPWPVTLSLNLNLVNVKAVSS